MAVFSRGFGARRRESDPRLPPGQYLTEDFPVLSAGPTPRIDTGEWTLRASAPRRGELTIVDVGRVHGAADRGRRRPTSTASRDGRSSARPGAASRSTRCSTTSRPTPTTRWCTRTAGTRRTCRWRTCAAARPGSRSSSTASRSIPSTAARRGCSCRTCTSGRAPSGCAASRCMARRRAGLLGAERLQHARRPLDRRALLVIVGDWRAARVVEVSDATPTARVLRVAVPGWPGSDPGQHVDIRLTAEDGYQAVRSYSLGSYGAGDDDRARRRRDPRRRGVAVPRARRAAGRRARGARARSAATSCGGPGERTPVQLIAGGSGIVPLMAMARARTDAAHRRAVPAAVLGAHAGRRDISR